MLTSCLCLRLLCADSTHALHSRTKSNNNSADALRTVIHLHTAHVALTLCSSAALCSHSTRLSARSSSVTGQSDRISATVAHTPARTPAQGRDSESPSLTGVDCCVSWCADSHPRIALSAMPRSLAVVLRTLFVALLSVCSFAGAAASGPVFDVTSYGAIGDNRTDCTASVSKALASMMKGDSGTLYFPSGTYRFSTRSAALASIEIWTSNTGPWMVVGDGEANTTLVTDPTVGQLLYVGTAEAGVPMQFTLASLTVQVIPNPTTKAPLPMPLCNAAEVANFSVQSVSFSGYTNGSYTALMQISEGSNVLLTEISVDINSPGATAFALNNIEGVSVVGFTVTDAVLRVALNVSSSSAVSISDVSATLLASTALWFADVSDLTLNELMLESSQPNPMISSGLPSGIVLEGICDPVSIVGLSTVRCGVGITSQFSPWTNFSSPYPKHLSLSRSVFNDSQVAGISMLDNVTLSASESWFGASWNELGGGIVAKIYNPAFPQRAYSGVEATVEGCTFTRLGDGGVSTDGGSFNLTGNLFTDLNVAVIYQSSWVPDDRGLMPLSIVNNTFADVQQYVMVLSRHGGGRR